MSSKQVIVMRTDLNMRKGKMCAQASHASMKVFFDRMQMLATEVPTLPQNFKTQFTPEMLDWVNWTTGQPGFTKIVLGTDQGEEEIRKIEQQAINLGIPNAVITDNGCTEFHGNLTVTCIALGPADSVLIDSITKKDCYKLL